MTSYPTPTARARAIAEIRRKHGDCALCKYDGPACSIGILLDTPTAKAHEAAETAARQLVVAWLDRRGSVSSEKVDDLIFCVAAAITDACAVLEEEIARRRTQQMESSERLATRDAEIATLTARLAAMEGERDRLLAWKEGATACATIGNRPHVNGHTPEAFEAHRDRYFAEMHVDSAYCEGADVVSIPLNARAQERDELEQRLATLTATCARLREALRSTAIVEWREDIERDHRIYPATLCKRCRLCRWRWHEYLGGDLRHDDACLLAEPPR